MSKNVYKIDTEVGNECAKIKNCVKALVNTTDFDRSVAWNVSLENQLPLWR